ncbi:MAG: hypothetical protein EXR86_13945 [Gammaproteobacteria bacterium]|nr:hypothetical protein [Gammaproteobacteria bacterium]
MGLNVNAGGSVDGGIDTGAFFDADIQGTITALFDEIEGIEARSWLNSNGVSRRARHEWGLMTLEFHGTVAPSSR